LMIPGSTCSKRVALSPRRVAAKRAYRLEGRPSPQRDEREFKVQ
jgi:hypothetical protein